MKTIRVVAAVIQRKQNGSKQIFATQRGYGEFKGGWEFPGGKIEVGETPQEASEEPMTAISMDCFWCELQSEHVVLNEHEDAKWLSKAQLDSVDWLPADVTLVDKIAKGM